MLIFRCYGVVVLSFMAMVLSTLIYTQSNLRLKIDLTGGWGGMTHQRKTFLKLYLNPPGKERKMDDSFNALFYMYYKRSDILISIKLNFHNKDNLE